MGNGPSLECRDSNYPDKIDSLCYAKCPAGWEHVPGMPYNCRLIGAPAPYGRGAGSPLKCPKDKIQDGALCYDPPQNGWYLLGGTYWQSCPPGTKDFGVGCEKEGYNRGIGKIPNLIASIAQGFLG